MLATTVTNPLAEVVAADAVQQPNQKGISSEKNNDIKLSQEQIDQFDKFVVVKDNSYVLDSKVNQNFSTNEVLVVKEMLNTSNREVKNNNLIIDPDTKEILDQNASPFVIMAAYNKNYTTKAFWWGKRYYFTSNIAVTRGARYFRHIASLRNDQSLFLSALGDSIAYASPYATLAANVASMGVGYVAGQYNGSASALVSYNNRHRHNQIYLDMNRTFQYSLHVLKQKGKMYVGNFNNQCNNCKYCDYCRV